VLPDVIETRDVSIDSDHVVPWSKNQRVWRPAPLATSSTGPVRGIRDAKRITQGDALLAACSSPLTGRRLTPSASSTFGEVVGHGAEMPRLITHLLATPELLPEGQDQLPVRSRAIGIGRA
jgi:hypothetical protein